MKETKSGFPIRKIRKVGPFLRTLPRPQLTKTQTVSLKSFSSDLGFPQAGPQFCTAALFLPPGGSCLPDTLIPSQVPSMVQNPLCTLEL